jgi:competence protein ComFC
MKSLRFFIHILLEIIFPEECVSCRKIGEGIVCHSCSLHLSPTVTAVDTSITALFTYDQPIIKKLLWELKYHSNSKVAEHLGSYLADSLVETQAEYSAFHPESSRAILVPVPISRARVFKRGFNQAESLARAVAHIYPESFVVDITLVTKTRSTKPQVTCQSRHERLSNVIGAFTAQVPSDLHQRQIIVIDDVATTGATMYEVIKVLREAGAQNVSGIVVAHGSKMC